MTAAGGTPTGAGTLHLIATPIGNLGDITERARTLLGSVEVLCCEDTRTSGRLLDLLGIARPTLLSLHAHNETERIPEILEIVAGGAEVGVVSDAGTPLLSDPGARLVRAATEAGLAVSAAPGASALLVALVLSGHGGERFSFEGFLPRKGAERTRRLAEIARSADPTVIYEAPGRVGATVDALVDACGPTRPIAVCRELTKRYEETWRGPLGLAPTAHAVTVARGEYVLVVGPSAPAVTSEVDLDGPVGALRAAGLTRRDIAAALEILLGVAHREAYRAALGSADPEASEDPPAASGS